MLTMYLRKETQDMPESTGLLKKGVAYYRDKDATQLLCRNHNPSQPDKRYKYVNYNCAKYKAIWLPDLV